MRGEGAAGEGRSGEGARRQPDQLRPVAQPDDACRGKRAQCVPPEGNRQGGRRGRRHQRSRERDTGQCDNEQDRVDPTREGERFSSCRRDRVHRSNTRKRASGRRKSGFADYSAPREQLRVAVMSADWVFIARLAGIGVFDPNGDQLGRVRETVAMLQLDRPPRVLGLVVEVQHRHRIFVPMGRVTRIEIDAVVLSTGMVNMRRFERRTHENLVLSELLDRSVRLSINGQRATIVDAAMERNRAQDWLITRLAVRVGANRITHRRGELQQLDWDDVDGLSLSDTQGTDSLLSVLSGMRPADVASALQDLPESRQRQVVAALDDERLADVFEELPEDDQVSLLSSLSDERAADILEAMNDDDAADLLGEMPADDQERLLKLMEPDEAAPVRRLMSYGDMTAGGLMTTEPVILPPDATVAEALALVRNPDLTPALAAQVFVVRPPQATPTGRFLGTVHLQRLLREPPSALVSASAVKDPDALRPDTPIAEITRHFATYNLLAAPVVDENERLLGAVSVDDVLDHLLPEDWRDIDADSTELEPATSTKHRPGTDG